MKMKWMTSIVLLATVRGFHQQCFTRNINSNGAAESASVSGITDFGLDLYRQLNAASSSENFFFSPYSIWTALILAYFGSEGETRRQIETTLKVSDKDSTVTFWRTLESKYKLQQNNALYTFNLANRAYVDNSVNLRPCTLNILREELRVINFRDTTGSAKAINDFVSKTTEGRISEVVTPRDLSNTVMALVNAVFFKGTWKSQFEPKDTRQGEFFVTPQDSAPLAMMAQTGTFRHGYSRQLGARLLELPYSGQDISMFVLLPFSAESTGNRFENMANNLNGDALRDAINSRNLNFTNVEVLLPKFKFEMKLQEELKMALINMGIVDLFDLESADLTAFDPAGNLAVSSTIHKSFVEVNEEGTEAAAVTAFLVDRIVGARPPETIKFHCNEPFIFLIIDNPSGNILFMGAVKNPRRL